MHEEKHALDEEESKIIQGALEMIDKQARHAMTPLKDVFMLEESTILDGATINQAARPFASFLLQTCRSTNARRPPIHIRW